MKRPGRRIGVFLGALAAAAVLSAPPQSVALQGLPRPRSLERISAEDRSVASSRSAAVVRSGRGSTPGRVHRPLPEPQRQDTTGARSDSIEANQTPQQGIAVTVQVLNLDSAPSYRFAVHQNYPNPIMNRTPTVIRYSVAISTRFKITVYSIQGQRIRTLVDRDHEPGDYSVTWDLTDESGTPVRPGIYFYRGEGGWYIESRRMIVR